MDEGLIKFVDDDSIAVNYFPVRTGLRSQSKQAATPITVDDRRSRYSEEVVLESSSDEENEILRPVGEAVLSQTPISSNEVFSFKKIKKKNALATAASEALHVKTPQKSTRQKIPKSEPAKTYSKTRRNTEKTPVGKKNNSKRNDKQHGKPMNRKNSSEESFSGSETSEDEEIQQTKSAAIASMMNKGNDENNNLEDMLDEYFLAHDEKNCLTSDRTLSNLANPRMDHETLTTVLKSRVESHGAQRAVLYKEYRSYFDKWAFQLSNGFNVLLHGLGTKRHIIDQFRSSMLSKCVQLVVNGFFPSITVKNILNSITNDLLDHDGTFKSLIEQCNFIKNYYYETKHEKLYLIIHNIDGAMLRSSMAQTVLSLLAQSPSIYLIASIDHIHAPLIWDQTQSGRFNWLWYDVTSFEPYVEETSYENSLLVQQSGSLALSSLIHVFRSLTANAKGVFILIANYQLEYSKEPNYMGLSFHDCYTKSREAFLVNSDATLRAQLTEFRDHKLIRSKKGSDGVEYLLIPLDDSTLKQFIEEQENN